MFAHGSEGIVGNGAGKANVGFDTPEVLERLQGGMVVELARVEAAHLMVRFHACVEDVFASLLFVAYFGRSLVDEIGVIPHGFRDDFETDIAGRDGAQLLDEFVSPGLVIEEDDRIVEPLVELQIPRLNGLLCTCQVLVPCEHDGRGLLPRRSNVWFLTCCCEGSVEWLERAR